MLFYTFIFFQKKIFSMEGETFSLPTNIDIDNLNEVIRDRKCLVVSFFGKSPINLKSNKANYIDEILGRTVFSDKDIDHDNETDIEPVIKGYYCPDRDVIFLHMKSWMDTWSMAEKCRQAEQEWMLKFTQIISLI